jgi:20S proteasome alpha/beta subunit
MSFVVTVYVPEGVVMASDSRQSANIERKTAAGERLPPVQTVTSDFTYKLFLLKQQKAGISAYGDALLGGVQMESHIRRLEEERLKDGDTVDKVADKLMAYFREKFPQANTVFHVAGFKKEAGVSIPHVYVCYIGKERMDRVNFDPKANKVKYGCSWGGETDTILLILRPYQVLGPESKPVAAPSFPILWDSMNLQDAIDFAIYAVRTTIDNIRFQARPKSVGGEIDVLLLSPEETRWVQRKQLHGERGRAIA